MDYRRYFFIMERLSREGVLLLKVKSTLYWTFRNCVTCYTESGTIEKKWEKWKQIAGWIKIVDLRLACLQLHITEKLWWYMLMKYKGKIYYLARLGFGLNVILEIMVAVLKTELAKNNKVKVSTELMTL